MTSWSSCGVSRLVRRSRCHFDRDGPGALPAGGGGRTVIPLDSRSPGRAVCARCRERQDNQGDDRGGCGPGNRTPGARPRRFPERVSGGGRGKRGGSPRPFLPEERFGAQRSSEALRTGHLTHDCEKVRLGTPAEVAHGYFRIRHIHMTQVATTRGSAKRSCPHDLAVTE